MLDLARERNAVLVTADKDFGELVFARDLPHGESFCCGCTGSHLTTRFAAYDARGTGLWKKTPKFRWRMSTNPGCMPAFARGMEAAAQRA